MPKSKPLTNSDTSTPPALRGAIEAARPVSPDNFVANQSAAGCEKNKTPLKNETAPEI